MIIVGSGLHRQVLKDHHTSPLCDWTRLLRILAKEQGVKLPSSDYVNPILAWEKIINLVGLRKGGGGKKAAHQIEHDLRKSIADLLREEQERHKKDFAASDVSKKLQSFLLNGGGHLVSLNFDELAYAGLQIDYRSPTHVKKRIHSPARKADIALLYNRLLVRDKESECSTIWHAHGSIDFPATIRLGLRDYGFMPSFYWEAFKQYKKWERKQLKDWKGKTDPVKSDQCHTYLLGKLEELDNRRGKGRIDAADTWVTRFMLLPVVFIGVGLSDQEIGLHWLLAQRERNFLKRKGHPQPVSFQKKKSEMKPFGLAYKNYESWDAAWNDALT